MKIEPYKLVACYECDGYGFCYERDFHTGDYIQEEKFKCSTCDGTGKRKTLKSQVELVDDINKEIERLEKLISDKQDKPKVKGSPYEPGKLKK